MLIYSTVDSCYPVLATKVGGVPCVAVGTAVYECGGHPFNFPGCLSGEPLAGEE